MPALEATSPFSPCRHPRRVAQTRAPQREARGDEEAPRSEGAQGARAPIAAGGISSLEGTRAAPLQPPLCSLKSAGVGVDFAPSRGPSPHRHLPKSSLTRSVRSERRHLDGFHNLRKGMLYRNYEHFTRIPYTAKREGTAFLKPLVIKWSCSCLLHFHFSFFHSLELC